MAIDMECNAAWGDMESQDGGEHQYYYAYKNGYIYALTNHWYQEPAEHYSMMLTKTNKTIIIGPRYFPVEMQDEDDDEEADEETIAQEEEMLNSKCICTNNTNREVTTHKINKNNPGEVKNTNKDVVAIAHALATRPQPQSRPARPPTATTTQFRPQAQVAISHSLATRPQ